MSEVEVAEFEAGLIQRTVSLPYDERYKLAAAFRAHVDAAVADERERLANEAYVRGDIGKDGPDVWDWLLSESAATANPKRWLTFPAQATP